MPWSNTITRADTRIASMGSTRGAAHKPRNSRRYSTTIGEPPGGGYRAGNEIGLTYQNTFQCIPLELPFRPTRSTPKPTVQGTQTAVVVGPSGEEIFTDKYGRVKVQFRRDRQGKYNGDSSCWIRVATIWAG